MMKSHFSASRRSSAIWHSFIHCSSKNPGKHHRLLLKVEAKYCHIRGIQGLNCTAMNTFGFFNVLLTTFFYKYFCPAFVQEQDNNWNKSLIEYRLPYKGLKRRVNDVQSRQILKKKKPGWNTVHRILVKSFSWSGAISFECISEYIINFKSAIKYHYICF